MYRGGTLKRTNRCTLLFLMVMCTGMLLIEHNDWNLASHVDLEAFEGVDMCFDNQGLKHARQNDIISLRYADVSMRYWKLKKRGWI